MPKRYIVGKWAVYAAAAGLTSVEPLFREPGTPSGPLYIQLDYNEVTDLAGLQGIDSLNYVYADYNQVETILPLKNNINLIQVNVWDNPIPEEEVKSLQENSIIVNYNPNYEPPEEDGEEA